MPASPAASALRRRLGVARRRFVQADAAAGLAAALGAGLGAWTVAAALEAWLWLPPGHRAVLVALVAAAALGALVLVRPYRPAAAPLVARRVAARLAVQGHAAAGERLLTAFDLAHAPASPLVDRATAALVAGLDAAPLEAAADYADLRRVARWAWAGPALLLAALAVAPGPFADASARLLAPFTAFSPPAPFALAVAPGDAKVAAGDSLRIVVTSSGRVRPAAVEAALIYADGTAETVRLAPTATGAFVHTVRDIRRPFRYRVLADPVETDAFRVSVMRRPTVERFRLTVHPPAYTGQPATVLPDGAGDVTGLRGTRVAVDVATGSADVRDAYLAMEGGRSVRLAVSAGRVTGAFTLEREGAYRLVLVSTDGLENAAPVSHRLALLPDSPPEVFVASPAADAALPADGRVALDVRATDDYGVASVALVFRAEGEGTAGPWQRRALSRPASRLDGAVRHAWAVGRVAAGQHVSYYVEARDALGQAGRSPVHRLRADAAPPAPRDPAEEVAARQDSAAASVQTLRDEAARARDAVRDLREALRGGRAPRSGLLQELQQRQAAQQREAEQARAQAQRLREELARQDASPETQEAYRQLQETLEELLDPEMQEALDALREALEEDRVDDAETAAERYAEQEEALRERLEQAQRLMERLRTQQQVDALAQRAEDLAQREREAAEQAREIDRQQQPQPGETPQERAEREEEAARRADALEQQQRDNAAAAEAFEEQMRALEQRMQQQAGTPRQQMQQAREQLEAQEVPEQIEQSAEALAEDAPEEAARKAEQAAEAMQRAQQQMRQMQQQMQQRQQQLDAAAMRRALDDVLRLSQQQETLRQRTQRASADSPSLPEAARQQEALARGVQAVADTMGRVAERTPAVSRALQQATGAARRQMEQAARQLVARQPQQAVPSQRGAMEGLNELAQRLALMLDQNSNSGSSGSSQSLQQMLRQMQQMSGEQSAMNAQTQRMINEQQGERLNPDGQQQARQMAERQQQLQRDLRNLARNPETRGRMLGDLQTLSRQMDAVAQELRRGRVTRELQEQQRQILSRMLEAQRSLQQRGEEQRREASPPGTTTGAAPAGTVPPASAEEQRRRDLLRALDAPYAPDVEALIRRYFQRLGRE